MNETTIQYILKFIYDACTAIENALDDDYITEDEKEQWQIVYDQLFEYTTLIEEHYGLIN